MDYAEHWPLLVGAAVLVVGHVYLYGIRDADWHPASPPLLAAVAVVIAIELLRRVFSTSDT